MNAEIGEVSENLKITSWSEYEGAKASILWYNLVS